VIRFGAVLSESALNQNIGRPLLLMASVYTSLHFRRSSAVWFDLSSCKKPHKRTLPASSIADDLYHLIFTFFQKLSAASGRVRQKLPS
jgi:hypothetical protein